jgi:hypothetical protein
MNESLDGLTLASWVAGVWYKHRRGLPLIGHEAAIVGCMEHHREWRARWDSLGTSNDPELSRDVLHVHYDAIVKMQIDAGKPSEIRLGYESLRKKEFTEFEALHTLIPALSEVLWMAKTKNEPFDDAQYIQLAQDYVKLALQRPTFVRRQEK